LKKIAILTDSSSSLDFIEHSYKNIFQLRLTVFFGDQEFIDGETITHTEFFRRVVEESVIPSTSQPSVGQVVEMCEQIAKEAGLIQVSDESELALLVKQVIDENPKAVAEVRAGKEKAMGFLIGQAMRVSKGSANPRIISRLVRKMLGL